MLSHSLMVGSWADMVMIATDCLSLVCRCELGCMYVGCLVGVELRYIVV